MKKKYNPLPACFKAALFMIFCACFTTLSAQPVPAGQFPFFRSFLDGNTSGTATPPGHNPTPGRTNRATLVDELGFQLTLKKEEVGVFILPNHRFTTDDGFLIEFEYMMYDTEPNNTGETDGIVMFLVDANYADNLMFGAEGAGYGYTYNYTMVEAPQWYNLRTSGIHGAYLAVALDNQNFKGTRFHGNELRSGITYGLLDGVETTSYKDTKYDTPSNVTIRGAAGRGPKTIRSSAGGTYYTDHNLPEGFWGYPMLATRHTGGVSDPQNLRNTASFKLNPDNGHFDFRQAAEITTPFNIAGKKIFNHPSESAYRKMIITLEPNKDSDGGFKITVSIQHGQELSVVIREFTYPKTVRYMENGLPATYVSAGIPYPTQTPTVIEHTVETPDELIIGFAASTGKYVPQTNVIKNLRISTMYSARAEDVELYHRRGPVTIPILDYTVAFPANPIGQQPSKEHVDLNSFRFWTDEYTCLLTAREHIVPNKGTWRYNPATGQVLFFPVKGFKGEVEIMYDVLGKNAPYDDSKYRSTVARIFVDINNNQP